MIDILNNDYIYRLRTHQPRTTIAEIHYEIFSLPPVETNSDVLRFLDSVKMSIPELVQGNATVKQRMAQTSFVDDWMQEGGGSFILKAGHYAEVLVTDIKLAAAGPDILLTYVIG